MTKPEINVTPLIDVLLVLLIIFMVVTPMKPSSFEAKVPREPKQDDMAGPHPDTLIVSIDKDLSLRINLEKSVGSVDMPQETIEKLKAVFREREGNYVAGRHRL